MVPSFISPHLSLSRPNSASSSSYNVCLYTIWLFFVGTWVGIVPSSISLIPISPKFHILPYMCVNDLACFVGTWVEIETNQLSINNQTVVNDPLSLLHHLNHFVTFAPASIIANCNCFTIIAAGSCESQANGARFCQSTWTSFKEPLPWPPSLYASFQYPNVAILLVCIIIQMWSSCHAWNQLKKKTPTSMQVLSMWVKGSTVGLWN